MGDQSSDIEGDIERIQFVVSNVRTSLKPGMLQSPLDAGESAIFGVQIYNTVMLNNIAETFFTYYNNRVNDNKLNHTLQPWFSGTANKPITLLPNQIWSAQAAFADNRSNTVTDLVFTVKTLAGIPRGGAIRFQLPPHFFMLTERVNDGILRTKLGDIEEEWGASSVYATRSSDSTLSFPGNLTLQRTWDGQEGCSTLAKARCEIPSMSVLTVRFFNVLTPVSYTHLTLPTKRIV